jgi:hypothetical protein
MKENLLVILGAMTDPNDNTAKEREIKLASKNLDGTYKKEKIVNIKNLTINDYSGDNLFIAKKDSSGNDTNEPADDLGPSKKVTGSLFDLLRSKTKTSAKGILDAENDRVHATAYQPYYETTVANSHNQRRWNCKQNHAYVVRHFQHTFLKKVLRDINEDTWNKVVDKSQ